MDVSETNHGAEALDDFAGTRRFDVRRRLGEGAFGVVYEAYDRVRDATVALKRLRLEDGAALYRFKQEFRKLTDVSHRNLVTLHELFAEDDRWFFAMEFVDGTDLLSFVRGEGGIRSSLEALATVDLDASGSLTGSSASNPSHAFSKRSTDESPATVSADDSTPNLIVTTPAVAGPLMALPPDLSASASLRERSQRGHCDEKLLRKALVQLASGLDALHSVGLLHRDVKPSNVMVSRAGRVVLLDFGLVSDRDDDGEVRIVGTPAYMAPEQSTGARVDESCDWYSVGVVLYEALTGRLPFDGNPREILAEKLTATPIDPRRVAAGVPDDLAELCMALLRAEPGERPTGAAVLEALTQQRHRRKKRRDSMRVLVGRAAHQEALWSAFDHARARAVEVVLLRGKSGTGKSTLARRFVDELRAKSPDALVLAGQCYEQESVPFEALDSLIDALAQELRAMDPDDVAELTPPNAGALTRLFPVLERVRSFGFSEDVPSRDPQELRRKATGALASMLDAFSERGPVVLFVDNLQWGDVDSAQVFDELLRSAPGRSLLFVGTFRTEPSDPTTLWPWFDPERLREHGATLRVLDVDPLSHDDALTVARALVGDKTDEQRGRAHSIARESQGNPYFLDVLARHVTDADNDDPERKTLPPPADARVALDDVLWARAQSLDPASRALLEVLAVAGVPISWSAARRAANLGDDAADALARLRTQRFARVRKSDRDRVECQHDRVREAVLRRIDAGTKQHAHHALAAALVTDPEVEPDQLALHFEGAGALVDAAQWCQRAAERAAQSLAFDRAARLYRKAIALRGGDRAANRDLVIARGDCLANAGRGSDAADCYLDAATTAPELEALELRLRAADPLLRTGHIDEGIEQLRIVLRGLDMDFAKSPQRALLSLLFARAKLALRGEEPALRASAGDARERLRVDTCRAAAQGLGIVDNIRGAEFNTRHYLQALELGEPYRVARATAIEAGFSGTLGYSARFKTAALFDLARDRAARTDNPHATGMVWLCSGIAACMEGRFVDGVRDCERAATILRDRCVAPWDLAQAQFYTLAPKVWLGAIHEIDRAIPALLSEYESRSDRLASTSLLTYLAFLPAIAKDDAARGRKLVDDAMSRWSKDGFHVQHYWALRAHVECDLYEDDAGTALSRLEARWGELERSLLMRVQYAKIEALSLRARALVGASRGAGAGRLLARAERDAATLEGEQVPWAVGLAGLVRAGIASKRGQRDEQLRALMRAERALCVGELRLHAAVARYQRGLLVGGEHGATLLSVAERDARVCGVRRLDRASAWLAPG
jgi:serine/threonine protein kinase